MARGRRKHATPRLDGPSCKGGSCTSVGLTSAGLTCEHGAAVRNGTATSTAPLAEERRWWRLLTVVIVTSPVPANPYTSVLRAVFAAYSRVEGLQRAQKLIHFDGPQPSLSLERKACHRRLESLGEQTESLAGLLLTRVSLASDRVRTKSSSGACRPSPAST